MLHAEPREMLGLQVLVPRARKWIARGEEGLESIRDAEAIMSSGGYGYQSAREMLDAALLAQVLARLAPDFAPALTRDVRRTCGFQIVKAGVREWNTRAGRRQLEFLATEQPLLRLQER